MDYLGGWFKVNAVREGVFAISEPFHKMKVRSYLVVGSERALLIDSGLGVCDIKAVVDDLTDLPVTVVTTHSHWDHIGGHALFEEVMVHKLDAGWLTGGFPLGTDHIREMLMKGLLAEPYRFFDPLDYICPTVANPHILKDGDRISDGTHSLLVIHTPGHSPGGISLFDERDGLLFTGDTIYRSRILAHFFSTSPSDLMKSIVKLAGLGAGAVLPGHFDDILPPSILQDGAFLAREMMDKGLDHHGTGLHRGRNLSFLF